jgi:hypothetical protein
MEIAKAVDFEDVLQLVESLTPEKSVDDRILQMEAAMLALPQPDMPLHEEVTPGLYRRERHVPANIFFTSETHKADHFFEHVLGSMLIWTKESGWQKMDAPFRGVTKAGTKRIVFTLDYVVFVTYHPNPDNLTDTKELHNMIFEKYENPYLNKVEEIA